MIDASLALQATVYARLVANVALRKLVPPANIRDIYGRPERFPAVIIGDGTTVYDDFKLTSLTDIHLWTNDDNRIGVKMIAASVREALSYRPWDVEDHFCSDLRVASIRILRDPNKYAHGVVSVAAILQERANVS